MEVSGAVEEVPQSELCSSYPMFYMPHHPVVRDSVSTKIRPVFDASASGPNGMSLNDCILAPVSFQIWLRSSSDLGDGSVR